MHVAAKQHAKWHCDCTTAITHRLWAHLCHTMCAIMDVWAACGSLMLSDWARPFAINMLQLFSAWSLDLSVCMRLSWHDVTRSCHPLSIHCTPLPLGMLCRCLHPATHLPVCLPTHVIQKPYLHPPTCAPPSPAPRCGAIVYMHVPTIQLCTYLCTYPPTGPPINSPMHARPHSTGDHARQ